MRNPLPKSTLYYTPNTLEELDERIQNMPQKDRALIYHFVMMTINTCHKLVDEQMEKANA